jgi:hypothetical protein
LQYSDLITQNIKIIQVLKEGMPKKLIIWLLFFFSSCLPQHAVTFQLNGGRFGDNLLSFISALYFSYQHNIPLLYPQFDYCDDLCLDTLEKFDPAKHRFDHIVEYSESAHTILNTKTNPTLVVTSFYNRPKPNLKDPVFRKKVQSLISPRQKMQKITHAKNTIPVALHIRTGGGFLMDKMLQTKYPLRFLPLDFYIDQIKRLFFHYPGKNFYIHLFTDDEHPEKMVDYLEKNIQNKNITYGYRKEKNKHNKNVLEDFFAMMQFEVLIRPISNFSKMAEYLGSHVLIITPVNFKKINNHTCHIDSVRVTKKELGRTVCSEIISYRA